MVNRFYGSINQVFICNQIARFLIAGLHNEFWNCMAISDCVDLAKETIIIRAFAYRILV